MNNPDIAASEESTQLLNVSLYDTRSTNTILEVTTETTTSDLLETIFNKTEICIEDQQHFKLVLVITGSNASRRNSTRHCVKTLQPQDLVLSSQVQLQNKLQARHPIKETSVRWFFKDVRSLPLELGEACDLTGDDSSEDDDEISLNDLSCIKQADIGGYLLRRSKKDPNVWQQRYCVLTDKLWCAHDRLRVPRASSINLDSSTKVQSRAYSLDCHGAIIIQSSLGQHSFIAPSLSEQNRWIDEINLRAALTADNDVIGMAEVIICDEAGTRSKRMQSGLTPYLECDKVLQSLTRCGVTRDLRFPARNQQDKLSTSDDCFEIYRRPDLEQSSDVRNKISDNDHIRSSVQAASLGRQRKFSRTYLREIRNDCSSTYEVLCFTNSVCAYKELFRHDLGTSSEVLWAAAIMIMRDCLVRLFEVVGVSMRPALDRPTSSQKLDINCIDDATQVTSDPVGTEINSNCISNGHQSPSIWDHISPKIALQLHRTVFVNIVNSARKTTNGEVQRGPSNVRSRKAFSKTPSAGGGDGGFRIFFGEGSSSNVPNIPIPNFNVGSGTFWGWTSRALGLSDQVLTEDGCTASADSGECFEQHVSGVKHDKNKPSKPQDLSCLSSDCNSVGGGATSEKLEGTYIVVKSSANTEGSLTEEVYLLKDKTVLPDYVLFDDLCDDLLRVLKSNFEDLSV